ncbi:VOC family protein [Actinomycetospora corticicola]|uniref:Putative glyoxalase superfamily protein PhnB n=1 Tax=Actinomycetospora corticicola TaxID=663602 RepID=A0A7Y9DXG6_9PSEU|nr:VOC family protein [Actinomycetospora corticicola]NYD37214.1 putative glyoxalase superfamily protein PhnB [Actinomycetospora corticicola]
MSTAPAPQVWPTLRARDARALIDFYVSAFGFTESVVYAGDDGVIHHAELGWPPGGGIMLGQEREDTSGRAWSLAPGTFGGYAVTRDAAHTDEVFARAVAAGATPLAEPYDTEYGSHDAAVLDPEGNHWQFGTYPGHPVTG